MNKLLALALPALAGVFLVSVHAQQTPVASDGARYAANGDLLRPADHREWVFLSSGLGMTYGPLAPAAGRPQNFDNVFVNRESYRAFMATGKWLEKTMFILEVRRGEEHVSIDRAGRTQGAVVGVEAAVKDSAKYAATNGWAYFSFDGPNGTLRDSSAPLAATASCYECHKNNTAVEQSFVQFYPTLFEVAKAKGTVKPTYTPLPAH